MKHMFAPLILISFLAACSQPKAAQPPDEKPDKTEEKAATETTIEISAAAQKTAGVKVAPVDVVRLAEYLRVPGTVQPIDSRVAHVRPIANGRLADVFVKLGDRVERSQALATFDNIEAGELLAQYRTARAELQRLKTQLTLAQQQAERNRRLGDIGAASRKEVELSEAEQKSAESSIEAQESVIAGIVVKLNRFGIMEQTANTSSAASIPSPVSGVVTKVDAAPGEVVNAGSELFQVADISQVWVQAEVFEKDLGRIQVGQTAFVTVDTYPGEEFQGRVTYIGDILDPQTRTAKIRCEISNTARKLKLDMLATVRVPTTLRRDALAVPAESVQQIEGKPVVFVQKDVTKFEARSVQIGQTVQGMTEIVAGLHKGDPIAIHGAFRLKSIALGKELGEGEEEH